MGKRPSKRRRLNRDRQSSKRAYSPFVVISVDIDPWLWDVIEQRRAVVEGQEQRRAPLAGGASPGPHAAECADGVEEPD